MKGLLADFFFQTPRNLEQDDIEEIKEGLEKACTVMYNQKLVKECQAFVDTYTASILEFLANGATPKEVTCAFFRQPSKSRPKLLPTIKSYLKLYISYFVDEIVKTGLL